MTGGALAMHPGSFIGDLQINAILGVGSFGITYLVSDPAIGTRFALKEYLPSRLASRQDDGTVRVINEESEQLFATGLKLFHNEARLVATLDHPNIVKVFRYFKANGTAYFLMSYYQGQPLHKLLESKGSFNREDARRMLLPLMDALEYIHQQGVIHLDIKPANIYMTDKGDPILLDFGVAAAHNADRTATQNLGSEGYAAPEQAATEGQIGPWTDIYGLAATLYRCVSGRIPSPASTRLEVLADGKTDPLRSIFELAPAGQYGGLTDAIEWGLKLPAQERPADLGAWKKSFRSLDWHRTVVIGGSTESYAKERKEWLPATLLGIFLLTMTAIGIFLLFYDSPQPASATPAIDKDDIALSTSPASRVQEPSAQEVTRWQSALKADTVDGYRRFMADFPASVYNNLAETQLEILDQKAWQELLAEDSIPAYEDYLEMFPDGLHQTEAMRHIDAIRQNEAKIERERLAREKRDNLAWRTASTERTIAALDQYIADWPGGLHIEEANRIQRLLKDRSNDEKAFAIAVKLNTKDAFQAYIDAFQQGVNVTAALQHMDELTLRPGKTFKDCVDCPAMIVVPPAAYWQGSDDASVLALSMEKPRRLVTIDEPFAVSIHEVTMAQWDMCFNDQGCTTRPTDNDWGRADRPVIMVSWNDAEEYVHWLSEKTDQSYRLPSESEWEYFARAGEQSDWLGGGPVEVCQFGNIAGAETGFRWQHAQCQDKLALGTAPVGSFLPNSFGLYDTTGNVSEWTADCMNLSYIDAPVDGSAWGKGICSSHMTRGGSWITGTKEIRLPARFNLQNGDRNDFTGFRVVRIIEE